MNQAQLSLHTVFMHTHAMMVNIVTFFMLPFVCLTRY